jgi:hypothetical protein
MFTSITWKFYLSTILLIGSGYYIISGLLLYYEEIIGWLKSCIQPSPETHFDQSVDINTYDSIMGGINASESDKGPRTTLVESDQINIASSQDQPELFQAHLISGRDDLLIGSVADLIEEIKTLVQLAAECKSDKSEIQSLFHALLIKYPHLTGTSYQDAISLYICENAKNQFSFSLQALEVNKWWKEDSSSSLINQ